MDIDDSGGVERHIYLDQTDVVLPYGQYQGGTTGGIVGDRVVWDLEAPTNVVATNSVVQEHPWTPYGYGYDGGVDLFVDGFLRTQNTIGPDSFVWFRPETAVDELMVSGQFTGWGGIQVNETGAGSFLKDARISHVFDGVFFAYPESCVVQDSQIHHYANFGIRVLGGSAGGLTVDRTLVARGPSLDPEAGVWGLYAEKVNSLRVLASEFYDYSHEVGTDWTISTVAGGGGIRVMADSLACSTQLATPDSILIERNALVGPSETTNTFPRSGISLSWSCGAPNRRILLNRNAMIRWTRGLESVEGRDVDVRCNLFKDNYDGVEFSRVAPPDTDPVVRLKKNEVTSSFRRTLSILDGMEHVTFGEVGSTADRGLNKFEVQDAFHSYFAQDDGTFSASDSAYAHQNYWYDGAEETTRAGLLAQCEPLTGSNRDHIAVADGTFLIGTYSIGCVPSEPSATAPALGGGQQGFWTLLGRDHLVAPEGSDQGAKEDRLDAPKDLPEHTRLAQVSPNPIRGTTTIRFDVGRSGPAGIQISIYDVRGGLVATILDRVLEPGRHEVGWDGRDAKGVAVVSGVYFLRFTGGGREDTRKLVYVR